jgi:hypothetical protein
VALVIVRWQPASLPTEVAAFAKGVVSEAAPTSAVRAKALLFGEDGDVAGQRRRLPARHDEGHLARGHSVYILRD